MISLCPVSTARVQRVIDLVHDLDVLRDERTKIERKIEMVTKELAQMTAPATLPGEPTAFTEAEAQATATDTSPEKGRTLLTTRSYADHALELVSANPRITTAELASALYGATDEASKNKARSVLYFLSKEKEKIRKVDGAWEIIPDPTASLKL